MQAIHRPIRESSNASHRHFDGTRTVIAFRESAMNHRYVSTLLLALAIVAVGFSVGSFLKRSAIASIRTQMKNAAQAGKLTEEFAAIDWDSASLEDLEFEVEPQIEQKLAVADFILELWFVWVPLLFAICLGIAYLTSRG
jgi:hypothetical protein